jgi:hypothetical protein
MSSCTTCRLFKLQPVSTTVELKYRSRLIMPLLQIAIPHALTRAVCCATLRSR